MTTHWAHLVFGAIAIFVIGGFCAKAAVWSLYLTARYRIWLVTGGMERLRDSFTTTRQLHEVAGIVGEALFPETWKETYWTPLPGIGKEDAGLAEQPVLLGKSLVIAGFNDRLGVLPETLGVAGNDVGIFPVEVEFIYLFTTKGDEVDFFCHRRMSASFYLFLTRYMGLKADPVCGQPLAPIAIGPPRAVMRRAECNVREVVAAVERGDHSEFKLFVMENPNDDDTGICVMQKGKVSLPIYFGEPQALRLWSQRSRRDLRPIRLEYRQSKAPQ